MYLRSWLEIIIIIGNRANWLIEVCRVVHNIASDWPSVLPLGTPQKGRKASIFELRVREVKEFHRRAVQKRIDASERFAGDGRWIRCCFLV